MATICRTHLRGKKLGSDISRTTRNRSEIPSYKMVTARSHETERLMGYHIVALRAFLLVKQQHVYDARAAVRQWKDSADAPLHPDVLAPLSGRF